ncbi:DUF6302 family protein [Streptomyces sp. NPDC127068]|uniref:DUF6302 family protein n=1 Tax=Streptomyces sp. NPDC127068 TaxID=3347127 RepID=UPI003656F7FD
MTVDQYGRLEDERASMAARLADPGLLDGAIGIVLEEPGSGPSPVRWSGLAVPVGGVRVCGFIQVPERLLLCVLAILETDNTHSLGFPGVRVHQPYTAFANGTSTTGRVEWGQEPSRDPGPRGLMLGYHHHGIALHRAESSAGAR